MLSKSQISLIKSLHQKKYRKEHQLFIVEGYKAISEFLNSDYHVKSIYYTSDILSKMDNLSNKQNICEVSINELEKISALQAPQGILAVIKIPENTTIIESQIKEQIIVLDGVQDPGNLGTIIRTADWFGFNQIICSEDCVEVYNPKVIQATMGSLTRVKVSYQNIETLLKSSNLPKYGTLLNGENIFNQNWESAGFLILGSEGKGISPEIIDLISHKITIPGGKNTESLNVGIAAAICCAEMSRNKLK
ncbi:TrmH family RNA methyltransferase [Pedobacter alpinus]|uniref:TrmH family RNA methyltransferase n=1 Tax=Pedobacter alpinus TaxID=1590643 RepID=A0ABW5TRJ9_9SPHI